MSSPLISVCIPAYKQPALLRRLLDSIITQSFQDFEVIISDDSPDEKVEKLTQEFSSKLPIRYVRNNPAKGTPENWNEAVRQANGQWIKIMHHDDWFASEDALEEFAKAAREGKADFIFSNFFLANSSSGKKEPNSLSWIDRLLLKQSPFYLLRSNIVGQPSTTMIRRSAFIPYDKALKWMVDIESYVTQLRSGGNAFYCIPKPLVCIGIHPEQVTRDCFRIPEVEIPEGLFFIQKSRNTVFNNFFGFDYYWRLLRNLEFRSIEQIKAYSNGQPVPDALHRIIAWQRRIPLSLLKIGIISKTFSGLSYTCNLLSTSSRHSNMESTNNTQ